ncbi:GspH/FimT family protein [Vitreoscilla massiliensis]|uniref:GspH/FimT family protein n=2 Tax=Vitreoscilla massiliensis TaxID=1689272 RepID=A0ABY4E681_9NEIS|nr:GspH/FimT family protein [Vitreoscilla massiliensis]
MNTLTFARNEAIRQNIPVVACGANLSSAGQLTTNGCGANWSEGLFLFGDVDGDHSYTAGKDINIRVTQSPNSNQKSVVTINVEAMPNTVSGTSLSSNPVVQFYPNGQVGVRVGSSTDDEFLIGSNFLQMSVISMDNSTISSVGLLDPVGRVINCGVKAKKENSGNKIAKLCKFES